ncbi:hypothetical protein WMF36_16930 [Sorangium sp. So ce887]
MDERRGLFLRQMSEGPLLRLAELGHPMEGRDLRQGVRPPRGVSPEAGDLVRADGMNRRGDLRDDLPGSDAGLAAGAQVEGDPFEVRVARRRRPLPWGRSLSRPARGSRARWRRPVREVIGVEPGASLTLRDVLHGGEVRVRERAGILTRGGKLAKLYTSWGDKASRTPEINERARWRAESAGASGRSPQPHVVARGELVEDAAADLVEQALQVGRAGELQPPNWMWAWCEPTNVAARS